MQSSCWSGILMSDDNSFRRIQLYTIQIWLYIIICSISLNTTTLQHFTGKVEAKTIAQLTNGHLRHSPNGWQCGWTKWQWVWQDPVCFLWIVSAWKIRSSCIGICDRIPSIDRNAIWDVIWDYNDGEAGNAERTGGLWKRLDDPVGLCLITVWCWFRWSYLLFGSIRKYFLNWSSGWTVLPV
jgi:hypothetical protein